MTTVTLFQDVDFQGPSTKIQPNANLTNNFISPTPSTTSWNDQTSSIVVYGNDSTFYRDINFQGPSVTLGPGIYTSLASTGIPNDSISSVDLAPGGSVTLYQDSGLGGATLFLKDSARSLLNDFLPAGTNWNDQTSSVMISGGSASFYRDVNFQGPVVTLGPGNYPSVESAGIPNDSISSVFFSP